MAPLLVGQSRSWKECLCRERIERAIEVGREAERFGAPPSQAISLMERADTIEALPVSTARGSIDLTRAHTHSPIREVTHDVRRRPTSLFHRCMHPEADVWGSTEDPKPYTKTACTLPLIFAWMRHGTYKISVACGHGC